MALEDNLIFFNKQVPKTWNYPQSLADSDASTIHTEVWPGWAQPAYGRKQVVVEIVQ